MKATFELDGIEINPPNNFRELGIEVNYDTDGNDQALTVTDWEFGVGDRSKGNDGNVMCLNQLYDKTGQQVIEGKPFKITLDDEAGKRYVLFDGMIDLWDAAYGSRDKFSGIVTAPAMEMGKIDWLNDRADSFTFEYLYSQGEFGRDMFVPVPYIIVKKQDAFEIVTTLVTTFLIIDKLKEEITKISQLITSAANPLEMSAIPRFVLQVTYLIGLFASLIPLVVRIMNMLMPPVKYHQTMYVKDLFQIGCDHIGLKFKSSILQQYPYNKMVVMPEKYNLTENTGPFAGLAGDLGFNNDKTGYFQGTFGDLIRKYKTMFFAKVVIANGVLYFEKQDFRLGTNGIKVPFSFENKDIFRLNKEHFIATMIVKFLTDLNDRHTIQEYPGTSVQVTLRPRIKSNPTRLLLKNFDEATIEFALGKRKASLTAIETILKDFLVIAQVYVTAVVSAINIAIDAINALIKILNGVLKALAIIGIKIKARIGSIKKLQTPNLPAAITNRIGMLKMESDYVSVAKVLIIDQATNPVNTKISPDNATYLNARYLFDNFHCLKSFVSINGSKPNQYKLRESDEIPFSFADFETIRNNNTIFTDEGTQGEALSIKYNPFRQTATITFKEEYVYITNLDAVIDEPTGK